MPDAREEERPFRQPGRHGRNEGHASYVKGGKRRYRTPDTYAGIVVITSPSGQVEKEDVRIGRPSGAHTDGRRDGRCHSSPEANETERGHGGAADQHPIAARQWGDAKDPP